MGKITTFRRLIKDDPSKIRLAISNNISHSFLSCFIPDKAYLKRRYTQSELLAIQNYIECEAHREVLCKGIKCKEN